MYHRELNTDQQRRLQEALMEGVGKEEARAIVFEAEDELARKKLESADFRFASKRLRESYVETLRRLELEIPSAVWKAVEVQDLIADGKPLPPRLALFAHDLLASHMKGESLDAALAPQSATSKRRRDGVRNTEIASYVIKQYVCGGQSVHDAWEDAAERFGTSSGTVKLVWQDENYQQRGYNHFTLTTRTSELGEPEKARLEKLIFRRGWYGSEFGKASVVGSMSGTIS